jgi:hypothetical protein
MEMITGKKQRMKLLKRSGMCEMAGFGISCVDGIEPKPTFSSKA